MKKIIVFLTLSALTTNCVGVIKIPEIPIESPETHTNSTFMVGGELGSSKSLDFTDVIKQTPTDFNKTSFTETYLPSVFYGATLTNVFQLRLHADPASLSLSAKIKILNKSLGDYSDGKISLAIIPTIGTSANSSNSKATKPFTNGNLTLYGTSFSLGYKVKSNTIIFIGGSYAKYNISQEVNTSDGGKIKKTGDFEIEGNATSFSIGLSYLGENKNWSLDVAPKITFFEWDKLEKNGFVGGRVAFNLFFTQEIISSIKSWF